MMAGDDLRPPTEPDGTEPPRPDAPPPDAPPPDAARPARETDPPGFDAVPAAELAAPDRPAESFGAAYGEVPSEKRSMLPAVLAVIGVVVVVLLGANLYALYNPPISDTLSTTVADVASLKQRVAAIEAKPQQTVDLTPIDQRLKDLSTDVATLKSGLAAAAAKADAAAALAPKLTAVQAALAALPKVDLGPLDARVAGLDTRLGALDASLGGLGGKLTALDAKTAGAAAATDKRLVPLEAYFIAPKSTVAVTEQRQNGSAAETRAAPLAVIAQGIAFALSEGRPFATETAALGRLGVDAATLAPLSAVADKGAPTQADLVAGFAAVQDRMVVAAAPVETGTMLDRMMANAASVVSVKRTGAAKGADAGAIASRIDADLKRGALAAALAEYEALPEDSKAAAADWASGLKARVAADAAARSIESKAVTALAAAP